ncbi:hypothetical protein [Xylella fastidiosa]|uniref:hypothetical protein n=1 Tax=Xylella fastidiosa TaxID=2371 RepID=UPI0007077F9D|nr:hypothetical protein [Xylella fastidiosa]KQH73617.1 hypothetical protein AOT81_07385 [Xylella fastidiosa]WNY20079.1 hypothetical protein RO839_05615 [Xylella fastidiosa]WNY22373.1 hypothetical protein RO838_05630 [Xylella fastidiosa]
MIVAAVRRIAAYLPSARLLFSYVLIASLAALVAHAALNLTKDTKLEERLSQPNQRLTHMESVLHEQAVINAKQEAAITQLHVLHDNDSRTLSRLQTDIRWLLAQRQATPCRHDGGLQ